ncbi:MAG: 1-acyl-sn-glycerol-3-phosphate acyltransferase [Bacteroidales bacterium]|nr:1-acyl-sn-glycerol-3-phosphate acyltransferase [Bacteroidales bacterium]MDD2323026.1 1-acyl-sn-glycerol-3-phosphate acyltransferase [Bacteroidales bacterium]MDD3010145.1 1-acyl-sn-glycerol-3-phosphate acyltransferase [Bacteroidales bacterium]MDD3961145.1 1-acyl-sn-glycerol-3-phosphate acyltransferase [Bacteroidales bacterium]MDY0286315.1 1-acyl-sn-glycerol-3-phosphate acyltransferase [Bacteroidales bacterium]
MTKIIQKYDRRYAIGKWMINQVMRLYHRAIWISGLEKIPKKTPVVYGPNHQNALIDALALIYSIPGQPVFLARADIFKKRFLAWLFRGIKMLPVYRIRDGIDNLDHNDEIFEQAKRVLVDRKILALFPEAVHNPLRRLLPLKKGIPRIVFLTEEAHDFKLGTVVIPVGIYYSDTDRFDETLHIQFGDPIPVADFRELFKINPQKAHLALRDAMAEGMRPLMIDIRDKAHYIMYECIRHLYNKPMRERLNLNGDNQPLRFKADKAIIDMVEKNTRDNPACLKMLNEKAVKYVELLSENGIEPQHFYPSVKQVIVPLRLFASLLLLPFFLYGGLNHLFPILVGMIASKKIPDPQFISSVKFAIGFLITPLFYLLQFFIVQSIVHNWLISFAYLITLPVAFILFKLCRRYMKTTLILKRSHRMRRKNPGQWETVLQLTAEMKAILNEMQL